MKKLATLLLVGGATGVAIYEAYKQEAAKKAKGTYEMHLSGFDWGCAVTKVILSLNKSLDAVTPESFVVSETKQYTDFSQVPEFPVVEGTFPRRVTDAYLCDENGNKVEEPSPYVAIELYASPTEGGALLFSMKTMFNTWSDPYYLTFTIAENATLTHNGTPIETLVIEQDPMYVTTDADEFGLDTFTATNGQKYQYAFFEPDKPSETLVVWLHGIGEGGTENTDPLVTVLANKVTALSKEPFQSIVGPSYILAPQCPTYWMDNVGDGSTLFGGEIHADGTSYYTQSLIELIDDYKEKVGAKKVVICGCSNGGYMTMVLAMKVGKKYDCYVPICEAVGDKYISEAQIETLAQVPLFFIYSLDDPTVDPQLHEIPTITRLVNAGATNLCVSTTEDVRDTSNSYVNEDGSPYKYSGHWSWIYFDNNESFDNITGIPVFEWIKQQIQ